MESAPHQPAYHPPLKPDYKRNRTASRLLRLLRRLETPCGVTIAKLAEEQGLSRRTVYRYLATLQEEFRIVEEDGRWRSIGGVL